MKRTMTLKDLDFLSESFSRVLDFDSKFIDGCAYVTVQNPKIPHFQIDIPFDELTHSPTFVMPDAPPDARHFEISSYFYNFPERYFSFLYDILFIDPTTGCRLEISKVFDYFNEKFLFPVYTLAVDLSIFEDGKLFGIAEGISAPADKYLLREYLTFYYYNDIPLETFKSDMLNKQLMKTLDPNFWSLQSAADLDRLRDSIPSKKRTMV